MSVVTNVIVTGLPGCYPNDDPSRLGSVIKALNEYLRKEDQGEGLAEVSGHSVGPRALETHVWIGGFNFLDVDEFIGVYMDALQILQEEDQRRVQLMIQRQDDNNFEIMDHDEIATEWDRRTREKDKHFDA